MTPRLARSLVCRVRRSVTTPSWCRVRWPWRGRLEPRQHPRRQQGGAVGSVRGVSVDVMRRALVTGLLIAAAAAGNLRGQAPEVATPLVYLADVDSVIH